MTLADLRRQYPAFCFTSEVLLEIGHVWGLGLPVRCSVCGEPLHPL